MCMPAGQSGYNIFTGRHSFYHLFPLSKHSKNSVMVTSTYITIHAYIPMQLAMVAFKGKYHVYSSRVDVISSQAGSIKAQLAKTLWWSQIPIDPYPPMHAEWAAHLIVRKKYGNRLYCTALMSTLFLRILETVRALPSAVRTCVATAETSGHFLHSFLEPVHSVCMHQSILASSIWYLNNYIQYTRKTVCIHACTCTSTCNYT